jgi:hypothetical protein
MIVRPKRHYDSGLPKQPTTVARPGVGRRRPRPPVGRAPDVGQQERAAKLLPLAVPVARQTGGKLAEVSYRHHFLPRIAAIPNEKPAMTVPKTPNAAANPPMAIIASPAPNVPSAPRMPTPAAKTARLMVDQDNQATRLRCTC